MKNVLILACLTVVLLCAGCTSCKHSSDAQTFEAIDTVPLLIMQVKQCSRLYTTEYNIHKILAHDDDLRLRGTFFEQDVDLPLPLGDRKVVIPINATLKGYIDFSDFGEDNVARTGKHITIFLPDPKVMLTSSKVDHENIREYVSLMRAHYADKELSAIEQAGRDAIISDIPQLGIVQTARESAARLLIPLLKELGFSEEDITISFRQDFNANDLKRIVDLSAVEKTNKE